METLLIYIAVIAAVSAIMRLLEVSARESAKSVLASGGLSFLVQSRDEFESTNRTNPAAPGQVLTSGGLSLVTSDSDEFDGSSTTRGMLS